MNLRSPRSALWLALQLPLATLAAQTSPLFRIYDERVEPLPGIPFSLTLADLDGDGDLDAAAGGSGVAFRVFRNDGLGQLTIDQQSTVLIGRSLDLHAGDVDGDGDLDILGAEIDGVLFNDGTGRFALDRGATPAGALSRSNQLAVVDLDGDGDLDLVQTGSDSGKRAYFNDGSGRFEDLGRRLAPDAIPSRTVAAGDVDGDGDVDVLFAGYRATTPFVIQSSLHLNDGTGRFTLATGHGLEDFEVGALASELIDVDGDGDLDYLIGQFGLTGTSNPSTRMLLNDGTGRFQEAPSGSLPTSPTFGVSNLDSADVDGDGDVDVLAFINREPQVWINDGQGRFTTSAPGILPTMPDPNAVLYGTAFGDLDDDGDPDLVFSTSTNQQGIVPWYNQSLQLDTDDRPAVGQEFGMEIGRRPLGSSSFGIAIPLVADQRARVDLGLLGMLGLLPERALALDPILLAPNGGHTAFRVAIPMNPDLEGLDLYWQALVIESGPGARDRLTNVWPVRVGR